MYIRDEDISENEPFFFAVTVNKNVLHFQEALKEPTPK